MSDYVGWKLGNYQITKLLGKGGFAEVYLGEHIHLNTHAAIKILTTKLTGSDVENFRTEARTIAQLAHPNIVRILDFGIEGEIPFLVMDYATGGTLRQLHPKGSRLPLATVIEYVKQIAEGLQYAHDQKFIHRDIKPENMLLGRQKQVLLSDFGIAVVAQSSRYQGLQDMAGTIAYMAPEQIQAYPRPASDQYSLAIVVYEWLCGQRPFTGTFIEIVTKHATTQPPPLRDKILVLPQVEQAIMKALSKDPSQRFASVTEFAQALERANETVRHSVSDHSAPLFPPTQIARPFQQPSTPVSSPVQPSQQSSTPITPPPPPSPNYQSQQLASSSPVYQPQQPLKLPPPPPVSAYGPPQQVYVNPSYHSYYPVVYQVQPQAQPSPPSLLPLVQGKPTKRDFFIVPAYSLLLLLFTLPLVFFSAFTNQLTSNPIGIAYTFLWFLVLLPSGTLLAGATLGSWRGPLAVLLYLIEGFIVIGSTAPSTPSTTNTTAPSSVAPIIILSLLAGFLLSSLMTGFMYTRRKERGCAKAIVALLPGSALLCAGFFGGIVLSSLNSTQSLASIIGGSIVGAAVLSVVISIPAALLETITQAIVAAIHKQQAKRKLQMTQ